MSRDFSKYYSVDLTEKILGEGNFGTVRRCVEKSTGLQFAVKIIKKRSEKEWEDVLYEAQILRKLKHPHIVVLRDSFQEKQHLYLVSDLVNGGELYQDIVTRKIYSEADASNSMHQILEAIRYCHQKGVVHSDLKPENILLASKTKGAPIKIADFGLAFEVRGDERDWFGGNGTLTHVSPEIFNGELYGKPTDICSCGVILYTLLVGQLPFDDEDDDRLKALIRHRVYYYPSRVRNTISTAAKHLIKQMLNLDQFKRYTAARALKNPWIVDRKRLVPKNHLPETVVNLKKFNARRKFKGGILAAMAANRFFQKPLMKKNDNLRPTVSTGSETVIAMHPKRRYQNISMKDNVTVNRNPMLRKRRYENVPSSLSKKRKMEN